MSTDEASDATLAAPVAGRSIALRLSGGGYRAMPFELGSPWDGEAG